jgi:hypothetical protein
MTINDRSLRWAADIKSRLMTQHTAKRGIWTLSVTEYSGPSASAPEGQRYLARVFSTRGTKVALKPTWCASLDDAKRLCVANALLDAT